MTETNILFYFSIFYFSISEIASEYWIHFMFTVNFNNALHFAKKEVGDKGKLARATSGDLASKPRPF